MKESSTLRSSPELEPSPLATVYCQKQNTSILRRIAYAFSVATAFDWLGLVSLFYGISNFLGYLMPKPFLKKNSSDII